MSKPTPLTNEDGEVRELSAADLRRFKPAHEVLPASLQANDHHSLVTRGDECLQSHRVWLANAHRWRLERLVKDESTLLSGHTLLHLTQSTEIQFLGCKRLSQR
jgi:hypothetical protein